LVIVAALKQFRRQPSLGFSDGLILELAREIGQLPLGTFDRNLGKLAGAERIGARQQAPLATIAVCICERSLCFS
jgi:predicted nucleic acid-binding protein